MHAPRMLAGILLAVTLCLLPGLAQESPTSGADSEARKKAERLVEEAQAQSGAQRIAKCDQAVKVDPTCASAYFLRGQAKVDEGEFNGALADLSRAATLEPKSDEMCFALATFLYEYLGERQAALAEFRKLKRRESAMGCYSKGMDLMAAGKYDDAFESFQDAWKSDKKLSLACDKAVLLVGWRGVVDKAKRADEWRGAIAEAKSVGEQAVAAQPDDPVAQMALGWALLVRVSRTFFYGGRELTSEAGREAEPARAAFEKAIQLAPNHPRAHVGMAVALVRLDKEDEGMASFERAIKISPMLAETYVQRGWCYFTKKEKAPVTEEKKPDSSEPKKDDGSDEKKDDGTEPKKEEGKKDDKKDEKKPEEDEVAKKEAAEKAAKEAAEKAAAEKVAVEEAKKRREELVTKALADFEKAVMLDPGHPEARLGRGAAYAEKSEFVKANLDFDAFARMNLPDHPLMGVVQWRIWQATRMSVMEEGEMFTVRGLMERAYLFLENQMRERAEKDYLRILELQPEKDQLQIALYNLCCIYSLRNEKKLAIEYLEKAVAAGYEKYEWMSQDADLVNIRDEPRYKELVETKLKEKKEKESKENPEEKKDDD